MVEGFTKFGRVLMINIHLESKCRVALSCVGCAGFTQHATQSSQALSEEHPLSFEDKYRSRSLTSTLSKRVHENTAARESQKKGGK